MAYDEALAERVRAALGKKPALAEIKMFGGLCWTIRGNMACGLLKDEFIARVAKEDHAKFVKEPGARTFDFTGRPMFGYFFISKKGIASPAQLKRWLDRCVSHCLTLKPKA